MFTHCINVKTSYVCTLYLNTVPLYRCFSTFLLIQVFFQSLLDENHSFKYSVTTQRANSRILIFNLFSCWYKKEWKQIFISFIRAYSDSCYNRKIATMKFNKRCKHLPSLWKDENLLKILLDFSFSASDRRADRTEEFKYKSNSTTFSIWKENVATHDMQSHDYT